MPLSQKVIATITVPGVYQDKNGLSLKVGQIRQFKILDLSLHITL